jgi:tripartite-type tricarboxylate transporter receptor subunit TctC
MKFLSILPEALNSFSYLGSGGGIREIKSTKTGRGVAMKRSFITVLVSIALVQPFFASDALPMESYPNKPVTMVLPVSSGMADTLMRVISKAAEKDLGQPIIIENKTGGGGSIGVNSVVKSKPDGYTVGMAVTGYFVSQPQMLDLPYNVFTDITDILAIAKYNFALCVKADAPWNTFEDVLAYAKKNPGKFSYGNYGTGMSTQISMERIAMKEGVKWTQIPFKSGGEAVVGVLGGHADAAVQGSVDVLPHLKSGKLKMLLVMDNKRWPDYPNIPTILEKGYDFYAVSFISVYGPKGMPEPIRQKLEDVFRKAMDDPSFVKVVQQFRVDPTFMSGKDYSALWRSYYEGTGQVLKALGLIEKKK